MLRASLFKMKTKTIKITKKKKKSNKKFSVSFIILKNTENIISKKTENYYIFVFQNKKLVT